MISPNESEIAAGPLGDPLKFVQEETALIAGALVDPSVIPELRGLIGSGDTCFQDRPCGHVWAELNHLMSERKPSTVVALIARLQFHGDEPAVDALLEAATLAGTYAGEHPGRAALRRAGSMFERQNWESLKFSVSSVSSRKARVEVSRGGQNIFLDEANLGVEKERTRLAKAISAKTVAPLEKVEVELGRLALQLTKADKTTEVSVDPAWSPSEDLYVETDSGFAWMKPTPDGEPVSVQLTNWTGRIISQVLRDDGCGEPARLVELRVVFAGRERTFQVPAAQLANVRKWTVEYLGTAAVVFVGFNNESHTHTAIQLKSGNAPVRVVYTHTGWRKIDGKHTYLHTAGAIDADGARHDIETEPQGLANFSLPVPPQGAALRGAVEACLAMLEVAPARITIPLFTLPWRAVLGKCDATLFLAGRTGARKSELASLAQQYFGRDMRRQNLPASWEDTANSLRAKSFHAKDALLVIDDFAPGGSQGDVAAYHRKGDQVLRGQNNGQGRGRCRSDGTPLETKPPRGTLLVTGEDVPRGHSLRARLLILTIKSSSHEGAQDGDVNLAALTRCQKDAEEGLYSAALAGFIRYVASGERLAQAQERIRRAPAAWRAAGRFAHGQTPDHVAGMFAALEVFTEFALEVGALSIAQQAQLLDLARASFVEVARAQGEHLAGADPVDRYRDLLRAAVNTGEAFVAGMDNEAPFAKAALGWSYVGGREAAQNDTIGGTWRPIGKRIGWTDGNELYLEPTAAFAAAQTIGGKTGEPLATSEAMLRRLFRERGLLARTDGKHFAVKVTVAGSRPRVLCFLPAFLLGEGVGQVGPTDAETGIEAHSNRPSGDDVPGQP